MARPSRLVRALTVIILIFCFGKLAILSWKHFSEYRRSTQPITAIKLHSSDWARAHHRRLVDEFEAVMKRAPDKDCHSSRNDSVKYEYIKQKRSFLERSAKFLQNKTKNIIEFSPKNTRELVYICLHSYQCGNWGDMIISILQGLLVAIATNRNFQICVISPCDFSKFYIAENYNWRCRYKAQLWDEPKFFKDRLYFRNHQTLVRDLVSANQTNSVFYTVKNSFMKDIIEIAGIPERFGNYTESELYQLLFIVIFKKSPRLNNLIEMQQKENMADQWLIDVVPDFRLHGEYDLTHNVTLMAATSHYKLDQSIKKAFGRVQNVSNAERKYVLSQMTIPGEIWDPMRRDGTCEQMTRSVIEFEIMLMCDALLLSYSSTSLIAGILRGTDYGLYCINYERIIPAHLRNSTKKTFALNNCKVNKIRTVFETQIRNIQNKSVPISFNF